MSQKAKQVRDCLGFVGLFLLLLFSLQTPLSIVTVWFLPLPFLILTAQHQAPLSIGGAAFLVLLLYFIQPYTILFCLYGAIIGIAIGIAYKNRQQSSDDVLLLGIVAAFVAIWVTMAVGQWWFSLFTKFERYWLSMWNEKKALFTQYGVPSADVGMQQLLAVFLLLFVVVVPILNFWLARKWLSHQNISREKCSSFYHWRLPQGFIYVYALILLIALFRWDQGLPYFTVFLMLFQLLFFIQGFIFCAFLLHIWGKSKLWLIPIFLVGYLPFLSFVLELLGVLDAGTHLRKRIEKR